MVVIELCVEAVMKAARVLGTRLDILTTFGVRRDLSSVACDWYSPIFTDCSSAKCWRGPNPMNEQLFRKRGLIHR